MLEGAGKGLPTAGHVSSLHLEIPHLLAAPPTFKEKVLATRLANAPSVGWYIVFLWINSLCNRTVMISI